MNFRNKTGCALISSLISIFMGFILVAIVDFVQWDALASSFPVSHLNLADDTKISTEFVEASILVLRSLNEVKLIDLQVS